jgi:cyclase
MEKLTDNVYVGDTFRGCNSSFVVTTEGTVIIDTPMVPSEAKQWREEVEKHGEIRYVINNEPHDDHVAGNCWLGGTLITHEGIREAMKTNTAEHLEEQMKWMAPDALPLDKDFYYRLPDITFLQEMVIYLGKHSFHIIAVPGHTPYQTAVYVPEERVVFTSDNVSLGMPVMIHAVPDDWLKSLKKLKTLDVDKIIPGHGPVLETTAIDVAYDNVQYVTKEVEAAITRGWSLEEIKEKVTFAERFPPEPDDPMKRMRHEGLTGLYKALKK